MGAVSIQKEDTSVSASLGTSPHQMGPSVLTIGGAFAISGQLEEDVRVAAEPRLQKLTAVVQWALAGETPVRPVLGGGAGSSSHSATSRAWVPWART